MNTSRISILPTDEKSDILKMNAEIEEQRQKLHTNYKMTIVGSTIAMLIAFILIPVQFEALYCGLAILAFTVLMASCYGRSLSNLKKEMELSAVAV